MVRVIAGAARGRRLKAPAGRAIRPTSDRVREALFSILQPELADAVVLDLYAGTGALGIEALSRGARKAVLVERDRRALEAIAVNLQLTGLADRAEVVSQDAARFAVSPRGGPFSMVLLDPPYAEPTEAIIAVLANLMASGALTPESRVVIERDRRAPGLGQDEPSDAEGLPGWLALEAIRTYGDTVLVLARVRQDVEGDGMQ